MNGYVQLVLAQWRLFLRNRQALFWTLLFPIFLMLLLGSIFSGGPSTFKAVLITEESSPEVSGLIAEIESLPLVDLETLSSVEEGKKLLVENQVDVVLVVSQGFTGLLKEDKAQLEVIFDETKQSVSREALATINQGMEQFNQKYKGYVAPIALEALPLKGKTLSYVDFLIPGILAMSIMNNNLQATAGTISSWRERGILRRMQATPLKRSTFAAAQMTARLGLGLFQAFFILLVGVLAFGTQLNGSILLLSFVVLLGTLTFMSMGFVIASLAKTPEAAAPIATIVSFPMIFLGGVFFPIRNAPAFLEPIITIIPITYLVEAIRGIMNIGLGLVDIQRDIYVLTAWLVVSFAISSKYFRWE